MVELTVFDSTNYYVDMIDWENTKTEQNGPLSPNTSINGIFECMPFTHVL